MRHVKVACVIGQLSRGGAEGQLYELIRGMDRERFQPMVISLTEGGYWAGPLRELGVDVVELKRTGSREFKRLFRLRSILKEFSPDVVHTMLGPANTYGRLAALTMLGRRPRTIAAERGLEVSDTFANRAAARILAPMTSAFIANSSYIAGVVARRSGASRSRVHVIYNGIDASRFDSDRPATKRPEGGPIIVGTVARLSVEKDFTTLLEAILKVREGGLDARLRIVGDGPMRSDIEANTRGLGLVDVVELRGMKNDIPAELAGMDIFALSSHTESLPNVLLEAMSARLPVVSTDVGGASEVVSDGTTGILVPPGRPDEYASAITRLIENPELRAAMGRAGRARVEDTFGMERMIRETEDLYLEVLGIKGARGNA